MTRVHTDTPQEGKVSGSDPYADISVSLTVSLTVTPIVILISDFYQTCQLAIV